MSSVRKRKAATSRRRRRDHPAGRKPASRGVGLSREQPPPLRFDHGLLLRLGVAPQAAERDPESLAAEGLLHRWGVEPGALHLCQPGPRCKDR